MKKFLRWIGRKCGVSTWYHVAAIYQQDSHISSSVMSLSPKIYRLGKANFNLGWNGSRLAQGGHQALLYASYPEVEEWVIANLVEAHV